MSIYKATVKFAWHVHHNVLLEPLIEPLKNRIAYIKDNKPKDEIATRLRLLKPVKGELPTAVVAEWKAYHKAWKAYRKARKSYDAAAKALIEPWTFIEAQKSFRKAYRKAWKAYDASQKSYDEVLTIHEPEILALHAIECPDCPWDNEQKTIFPEVEHAVNPKTH